jgi:Na+-driven multidrug efflux pump
MSNTKNINVIKSLRLINYNLFFALLVIGLVPTVYTTVRIFFLGQLPNSSNYDIASQLQWVNVLYEIIQETLILPLFYFTGKVLYEKNELTNRVRTGMIVVFCIYSALSLLIIAFAKPLLTFMSQSSNIINETATYIRFETIANIFAAVLKFLLVIVITIKREKYLYLILCIQLVLSILLDTFFVSDLSVSLEIGVNGIALTNIIVNFVLVFFVIDFLNREQIKVFSKEKLSFKWIKNWSKVGGISGLESLIRNFVFMVMIVRMTNIVGEQGTFWLTNNFIWGWLLLPILQLGELVKRDCGENGFETIKTKTKGYFLLTTFIITIWFISMPFWKPFLHYVMGLENFNDVFYLTIISIGFYVLFAYNNIIDSVFYGMGKTNYILFKSLIINILLYGFVFLLYINGIYKPTLINITLLFGISMAIGSVLTYGIFVWFRRKYLFNKMNIVLHA